MRGAVANDHQVERIALDRSRRVSGAARLLQQPGLERRLIEVFDLARCLRFDLAMGEDQTRHLKREAEIHGVAAAQ